MGVNLPQHLAQKLGFNQPQGPRFPGDMTHLLAPGMAGAGSGAATPLSQMAQGASQNQGGPLGLATQNQRDNTQIMHSGLAGRNPYQGMNTALGRQGIASSGGRGGAVTAQPQSTPYQSPMMSGARGFNPLGENIHSGMMPSFSTTNTVQSAGGDAHMPSGTSTMQTAARIGQWQGGQQAAEQAMRDLGRGYVSDPRAGGATGATDGDLLNRRQAQTPFGRLNTGMYTKDPEPWSHTYRLGGQGGQGGGAPAGPAAPAASPNADVATTINGDRPIYDQNFIQRLVNQKASDARRDPREALKMFDIPGMSRDEGQYSSALPSMVASRTASNRAMSEIPMQAELANRMYQLQGQDARGQEALSLANILRTLQGSKDQEHTALMSATLDPLVALLSR